MAELQAYREGIFSESDPMAPYGADMLQSYSDGSLGRAMSPAFASCASKCLRSKLLTRSNRRRCMQRCRTGVSGTGLGLDSGTWVGLGVAGVLALALVAMPIAGSLSGGGKR